MASVVPEDDVVVPQLLRTVAIGPANPPVSAAVPKAVTGRRATFYTRSVTVACQAVLQRNGSRSFGDETRPASGITKSSIGEPSITMAESSCRVTIPSQVTNR